MPPTRIGRYEVVQELGAGAMGKVYLARDPRLDRQVAVKMINLEPGTLEQMQEDRQRFFREAQAAGKLAHPGIVTIHDADEDEATHTPYIVMEYIPGRTLEECMQQGRLPVERSLELVKQVAEALDYAHQQGIIHRDIKPANIIVTDEGRAKITDFGLAKFAGTKFTRPGQVLGTPSHMSPEQLRGEALTGRSDLFSLGVVLYTLLTGEKPFAAKAVSEVVLQVAYEDPPAPSVRNPALRPEFDYVLARALAKDPDRRYQRGQDLANDLEDLKAGRSVKWMQGTAVADGSADRSMSAPLLNTMGTDQTLAVARTTVAIDPPVGAAAAPRPAPAPAQQTLPLSAAPLPAKVDSTDAFDPNDTPVPPLRSGVAPADRTDQFDPEEQPAAAMPEPQLSAVVLKTEERITPAPKPVREPRPVPKAEPTVIRARRPWVLIIPPLIILLLAVLGFVGYRRNWFGTKAAPATIVSFQFTDRFESADFEFWVDGTWKGNGPATAKSAPALFNIAPGHHTVRVRLTAIKDRFEQFGELTADFPAGKPTHISVGVKKNAKELVLKVQ